MYERILLPTDGSERAEQAAEHAVEIAKRFDATIHAIYVIETNELRREAAKTGGETITDPPPFGDRTKTRETFESIGHEALETVESLANEAGVEFQGEVLGGTTGGKIYSTILDYLANHDIELIVMGTHGRTGLTRAVLGSVTERVLRTSDVPVVAVPE
jgi:nucleotide-binding universal stress UspA family protein